MKILGWIILIYGATHVSTLFCPLFWNMPIRIDSAYGRGSMTKQATFNCALLTVPCGLISTAIGVLILREAKARDLRR